MGYLDHPRPTAKQACMRECMHEWVLFTCFPNIMTGCCCTQYDDSSKFIIVKGIIIFKHNRDRVVNIMLNQLTSHNAMLQVALLVGKHASRLAAKLNIPTRQIRGGTQVIAIKLLTCIHFSLLTAHILGNI